jgi:pimeloyl-ACP methyl ester carboxylesterase
MRALLLALACLLPAIGCGGGYGITPATEVATSEGYHLIHVPGGEFEHIVMTRGLERLEEHGGVVHVYIEGDGGPWTWGLLDSPSPDPTPQNPLMARLMTIDAAPSIYLGRPCYFGESKKRECRHYFWTHGRYSRPVVRSMRLALERVLPAETRRLAFFGYDGGGALAWLLARDFPEAETVVTLAPKLDIAAWARHAEHPRMAGSINPAREPALSPDVRQIHLFGELDLSVPPRVNERFLDKEIESEADIEFRLVEGVGHDGPWEQTWRDLLAGLRQDLVPPAPALTPAPRPKQQTGQPEMVAPYMLLLEPVE